MENKYEGKFIGGRKIVDMLSTEEKTPGENIILNVMFEDGSSEIFPERMLQFVATDEPLDPSALQDRRIFAITAEILKLFGEFDMKLSEWERIQFTIKASIDDNYENACEILWKTPKKGWLDVVRVLKSVPSEDKK